MPRKTQHVTQATAESAMAFLHKGWHDPPTRGGLKAGRGGEDGGAAVDVGVRGTEEGKGWGALLDDGADGAAAGGADGAAGSGGRAESQGSYGEGGVSDDACDATRDSGHQQDLSTNLSLSDLLRNAESKLHQCEEVRRDPSAIVSPDP
jgi:hypothetical protein